MKNNKKVWVIWGVGGYLGSEVAWALLRRGYIVHGYDNFHKGQCDHLFN